MRKMVNGRPYTINDLRDNTIAQSRIIIDFNIVILWKIQIEKSNDSFK